MPPIDPIENIFFYRSFLCFLWPSRWEILCLTYGYSYSGNGTRTQAKEKIDYFLKLRADKTDRQNSEAVYSVGNWGKDSLPITNCKLPIVKKKPSDISVGGFFLG
jgi:hypothetical protein